MRQIVPMLCCLERERVYLARRIWLGKYKLVVSSKVVIAVSLYEHFAYVFWCTAVDALCTSTNDCSIRRCSRFFKFSTFSNSSYEVILASLRRVLKANAFVDSNFSDRPLFRPRNSGAAIQSGAV